MKIIRIPSSDQLNILRYYEENKLISTQKKKLKLCISEPVCYVKVLKCVSFTQVRREILFYYRYKFNGNNKT